MNLFLLGAGFNADAKQETGPVWGRSPYEGQYQIDCGYPLVRDVTRLCFGLSEVPDGKSIEDLFAEAAARHDSKPLEKLSDRLMEADYRLATNLSSSPRRNCYRDFFEKFVDAHFLTFNYDSLPEIFLHRLNRWYPHDGYGVPVEVKPSVGFVTVDRKSASLMLHLHGSFCVLTTESDLEPIPGKKTEWTIRHREPKYSFDAESISGCFPEYGRVISPTGPIRITDRVIAPVPNKAEELKQPFIRQTYDKASTLVRRCGTIVAVGYSFNTHDRASYDSILKALAEARGEKLVVVSPDAGKVADRIKNEYRRLRVEPVEKTLKAWAASAFRL